MTVVGLADYNQTRLATKVHRVMAQHTLRALVVRFGQFYARRR